MLGEVSFGILKQGELGKLSFGMLKLREFSNFYENEIFCWFSNTVICKVQ